MKRAHFAPGAHTCLANAAQPHPCSRRFREAQFGKVKHWRGVSGIFGWKRPPIKDF
jgi:hypothetical protein